MNCTNCEKEVDESVAIKDNGRIFCNNLCKYSFSKTNKITTDKNDLFQRNNSTALKPISKFPYSAYLLSIAYFIVIYFAICSILGAIVGAVAGAQNPSSASTAGYSAGFIFVQQYKIFIIIASFIITQHGTLARWLPFMKKVL